METHKPLLKDEDGEYVDVHLYRSMIGSLTYLTSSRPNIMFAVCVCARYQVNPKASHLHDVKRIFRWYQSHGALVLGLYKFGIEWKVKTINGEAQLHALVDGKKIINTESIVRRDLQLEDAEGVFCLPIATIFEQLTLMGYEKISQNLTFYKEIFSPQWKFLIHTILQCLSSKTTAWNEFSSTMASAIICLAINQKFNFSKYIFENKAIYKERDDSLVRADTTASSLEVEQDSGNINKTRSKATLNEPSSPGTSSGSGPKCQETMRDTIAQTRFENVSKTSNDSLLAGVLDLETTKTAQAQEITSLKRRVKKLEQKRRSKTHGLKRLYKVGSSRRVESSKDESLVQDVDKEVKYANLDRFRLNDLVGDEVFGCEEQIEQAPTPTVSSQQPLQVKIQDKGKQKMIEPKLVKKLSKKDQLKLDEELAFKLQAKEE
ncbi:hypothetical protein Tco_0635869 [Tanacetum coccineum]